MTDNREERTAVVSITVTPSLRQFIRRQAFDADTTVSSYLNGLLEQFFLSPPFGNMNEALAEANGAVHATPTD